MPRRNHKRIGGWITLAALSVFILIACFAYTQLFDVLLPDNSTTPVTTPAVVKQLPLGNVLSGQWVEQTDPANVETTSQATMVPNQATQPLPPTHVQVEDTQVGNRVYVAWGVPVGQLYDGVTVERDVDPAFPNPVAVGSQLPPAGELFDTDVENLTTYYYRFQAFRNSPAQVSAYSATVSVIPHDLIAPPPVIITSAENIPLASLPTNAKAGVQIRWEGNPVDVANYHVYRSTQAGVLGNLVGEVDAAVTQFEDTLVDPGVTYYYAVIAVDAALNKSATSVTVPAVGNLVPFVAETSANNTNGN